MFSTARSAGDTILATDQQNLRKDAVLLSNNPSSFTYDSKGRLSTIVFSDMSVTYTITYNGTSDRIASVSDGTIVTTYNYDSLGRLSSITHT